MASYPDPRIWDDILAHLKRNHPGRCRAWFEQIEVRDLTNGVLRLAVRQPLQLKYLQRECVEIFQEAAQAATNRLVVVTFMSADEVAEAAGATAPPPASTAVARSGAAASNGSNGHHDRPVPAPSSLSVAATSAIPTVDDRTASPTVAMSPSLDVDRLGRALSATKPIPQPRPVTATTAQTSPSVPSLASGHGAHGPAEPLRARPRGTPSPTTHAPNPPGASPKPDALLAPTPIPAPRAAGLAPAHTLAAPRRPDGTPPVASVAAPATSPHPSEGFHGAGGSVWGTLVDEMVINPDYSFETFIVGPSNRLAHAGAKGMAFNPKSDYNPFFVHGGVGLGKTHLLHAICQTVLAERKGCKIYYVSCEGFMSQFMDAVQAGQMNEFRHRFRHIDVLVVDDIHFLAAYDRTQEEFFHTFNSLHQAGKQIVLSSDAAPDEIPKLEERLVSRFMSGLVAPIDKPCYETRIAILRVKAQLRGLKDLPDDVICYIAHHTDSNIRELEGALTRLQALSLTLEKPIDLELAKEAVGEAQPATAPIVSIQAIIAAVSRHFDLKQTDLLSKRRHKSVALPRQVAMYLARTQTRHSLQEVGGFFGGRDHTTVMHAVSRVTELRASDPSFGRRVDAIERDLGVSSAAPSRATTAVAAVA